MAKWTDEKARATAVASRHNMISIIIVSISVCAIMLGGIGGCTAYHIEKVKIPVKYQEIENFERGNDR